MFTGIIEEIGKVIRVQRTAGSSFIEIQAENAKKMNISDFLRGNVLEVGKKFE